MDINNRITDLSCRQLGATIQEKEKNIGNIDQNSEKEVWKWVKWEENIWKSKIWGILHMCVLLRGVSRSRRGLTLHYSLLLL